VYSFEERWRSLDGVEKNILFFSDIDERKRKST
jgi:hypothetical protein